MAATINRRTAADENEHRVQKTGGRAKNSQVKGGDIKGKTAGARQKSSGTGGTGANAGGKATSGKNQRNVEPAVEEEDFIGAEVLVILSFAIGVLLFLSNFHLCGIAGKYLRAFQLGIFGIVGFIAPLLLFVGTCFYLSNRGNRTAMRKLLASIGAVLVLCGFAQLLFGKEPEAKAGIMEYYRLSAESSVGGGLIGGLICKGLTSVLGNVGAFLVLVVGFAVSAVCITERSLVKVIKKQGDAAYRYAREDMNRRREARAEQKEEQRRIQKEQRIRGVNLDSTDLSVTEEDYGEPKVQEYQEYNAEESISPEMGPEVADSHSENSPTFPESDKKSSLNGRESGQETKTRQEKAEKAAERPEEPAVDPADVFTGRINMPSDYEGKDQAPFEADEVLSPAESAQRLVAEGISRLSDSEGSFGRPAEPPAFHKPASEPSFHGLSSSLDERTKSRENREEIIKRETAPKEEAFKREMVPEPEDSWDRLAMADGMKENLMEDPGESEGPGFIEESEPVAGAAYQSEAWETGKITQISRPPVVRYEEEPEEEEIFMDGCKESSSEDYAAYYEEEEEPDAYVEADIETKRTLDRGIYENEFVIPEESKRVITASGKVIESDTEALAKKLESKRQEAREAFKAGEASVQQQIQTKKEQPKREYIFPSVTLLKRGNLQAMAGTGQEYKDTAVKLQQTLRDFGVGVTVTNISCGPAVTRYELHPEQGVKVSKIVGLADDIKLSLAAADIRIEAPIPGKSAVGIEVPNKENITVYLRELLESEAFRSHPSRLAFAVGKDIGGQVVVTDIAKMPHLLIAGATGSGKSVCINTLIMSILFKSSPDDVKLIMVDPKVVELSVYNGIPHLLIPVVTDPKKASGALNWAVAEMQDRYKKFAACNVRNISGYNSRIDSLGDVPQEEKPEKMPQIIIIVDELADLMMVAPGEVEDAICRLAQLARAAGIHLVIATQRPSVNVITGLIKANVPSRIAFSVSSGVDSRTIIDMYGAEKLLGKGDMLFFPSGIPKPVRVQGAFVSDSEVQRVVEFLAEQGMTAQYDPDVEKQMSEAPAMAGPGGGGNNSGRDEYFEQAGRFIIEKDKASIGMLQRMFKIGFNRAARIMDQLADAGVVGDEEGTKPRKILITMEEFEELL